MYLKNMLSLQKWPVHYVVSQGSSPRFCSKIHAIDDLISDTVLLHIKIGNLKNGEISFCHKLFLVMSRYS